MNLETLTLLARTNKTFFLQKMIHNRNIHWPGNSELQSELLNFGIATSFKIKIDYVTSFQPKKYKKKISSEVHYVINHVKM